jgi:hypothetical protein
MLQTDIPFPPNILAVLDSLVGLGKLVKSGQRKTANVQPLVGDTLTVEQEDPQKQEIQP